MSIPTNNPETPMGDTEQDSFFGSKETFHQQLQDIFQTILRLTGSDHFDQLCQWMEYKEYYTIDDFFENSYHDLENFDNKGPATEYKWKGRVNHHSPIVTQKLKCFIKWMTHEERPFELHDDFLATLSRDSYLKFRHLDTQSFSSSPLSQHEPSKSKTSFQGNSSTKQHQSPKLPLTTSRREPRGIPQSIPYSRMTSTMIHLRGHSWQISRHKASMMLLTMIMILRVVISMSKNFSRGNSPLYILFWLLLYKQKRGEN